MNQVFRAETVGGKKLICAETVGENHSILR